MVSCHGRISRIGATSFTIVVKVWMLPELPDRDLPFQDAKVAEATITCVFLGEDGQKQAINKDKSRSQ